MARLITKVQIELAPNDARRLAALATARYAGGSTRAALTRYVEDLVQRAADDIARSERQARAAERLQPAVEHYRVYEVPAPAVPEDSAPGATERLLSTHQDLETAINRAEALSDRAVDRQQMTGRAAHTYVVRLASSGASVYCIWLADRDAELDAEDQDLCLHCAHTGGSNHGLQSAGASAPRCQLCAACAALGPRHNTSQISQPDQRKDAR